MYRPLSIKHFQTRNRPGGGKNMKYEAGDVKESKPCKNDHAEQYIKNNKKGTLVQYCKRCDRQLKVR
jgi:hypothetical protein